MGTQVKPLGPRGFLATYRLLPGAESGFRQIWFCEGSPWFRGIASWNSPVVRRALDCVTRAIPGAFNLSTEVAEGFCQAWSVLQ